MKLRIFVLLLAGLIPGIQAFSQSHDHSAEVYLPEERAVVNTDVSIHSATAFAKQSSRIQQFAATHSDWQVYAPHAGQAPHRAWGSGIQVKGYPEINLLNSESAGRTFIGAYADVLQTDPAQLKLLYTQILGDKVYQKYIQQYNGLDVLYNYVDLRLTRTGKVVMFGSDYRSDIAVNTTPSLSIQSAKTAAVDGLERRPSSDNIEGGKLYILPVRSGSAVNYHLVYNFVAHVSIDEAWDTYVDAHSGDILWRKNLVLHGHDDPHAPVQPAANIATGQIMVKVFNPDPRGEEEFVGLPFASINFQGTHVTTDADGRFSVDLGSRTSATGVARLSGPYASAIRNDRMNPNEETLLAVPVDINQESTHYWDESNSESSERNGFYHTTVVSRWIRAIDQSEWLVDTDSIMPVNVNYSQQSCNANWNGQAINFYEETNYCRNTATLASVIYHEYGHAINTFLYNALMGTRTFNRAMEEGNADITAALLLDDPRIGLGMYKNDQEGLLRNCDNTFRYPDDFSGQIHSDGRIIAGAMWDTRERIGLETTARLAHMVKYGTPDNLNYGIALADYFIELLVADDDNGDLSDGTPHSDEIIEAFRIHGIPASGITIEHEEITNIQTSASPYVFQGKATVGSEIAPDRIYVSDVKLIYSDDNWQTSSSLDMAYDKNTGEFEGTMPAMQDGAIVRYYFEATDNIGSSVRYPTPVPSGAFAFVVGYTSKAYTDMSTDEGWTVSGDATTGIWVRERPRGTYVAAYVYPPYIPWVQANWDHTTGVDSVCWVTGNTVHDEDLQYLMSREDVDDGATVLTSSSYSIADMANPTLRYYRWYTNNAGSTPDQDEWVVELSDDGGATWKDIERTNESIANWTPRIFPLKGIVEPGTESIIVRFTVADDEPGSLVEGAMDDFEILDFTAPVSVGDIPLAGDVVLHQNYPNPFNPTTSIRFSLPTAQRASIKVYDVLGNLVAVPFDGMAAAGTTSLRFDAAPLSSGMYIYRLTTAGGSISKQMVLSR